MGGGTHVLKVFWSKLEICNGIPHVVGGAMAVDAVMSMVGTGLGDAVVEAVYGVVLAHAGHIGADWHVGCKACNGIPHVAGGAMGMAVDAVMSMVGVGLGDAVVEAVLPGREVITDSGHAMEAHA